MGGLDEVVRYGLGHVVAGGQPVLDDDGGLRAHEVKHQALRRNLA